MKYSRTRRHSIKEFPGCCTDRERLALLQNLYRQYVDAEQRKPRIRKRYATVTCLYCGAGDLELIMLRDSVWREINPSIGGWVCLSCMEKKLGRPLMWRDLRASENCKL